MILEGSRLEEFPSWWRFQLWTENFPHSGCRPAASEVVLLSCSAWEEAGCVVLRTEILEEWVDCRGVSTVPCLRVTVNLTGSNQTALLHLDEELVLHALEVQLQGTEIHILDLKKKKKSKNTLFSRETLATVHFLSVFLHP